MYRSADPHRIEVCALSKLTFLWHREVKHIEIEEKRQICAPRKNHGPYHPFGG